MNNLPNSLKNAKFQKNEREIILKAWFNNVCPGTNFDLSTSKSFSNIEYSIITNATKGSEKLLIALFENGTCDLLFWTGISTINLNMFLRPIEQSDFEVFLLMVQVTRSNDKKIYSVEEF